MADETVAEALAPYKSRLEQQSIDAVTMVDELAKAREARGLEDGLYHTEKGVVLKFKKFPARLVVEATSKLTEPVVPVVFLDSKQRNEPNENDPQYKKDKQEYGNKLVSTLTRVNLGFGTEVVAYPEGFEDVPESEAWAADLTDLVGIEVPAVGTKGRYVAWLQYFVLSDMELAELNAAVLKFTTGIVMGDVVAAEATFPSVPEGGADTPSTTEGPEDVNPDTGGGSTGTDAGVRGEGSSEVQPAPVVDVPTT